MMNVEQVRISGFDVYVAKNNYVDNRMLNTPSVRESIEGRMGDVLGNLYYHRASQTGPLRRFKRMRLIDDWRLYFRAHEERRIAVVTALIGKEDTQHDGGMDQGFIDAMLKFEHFDWGRMEPLAVLDKKGAAATAGLDADSGAWLPKAVAEDISEEEAFAFLSSRRRQTDGLFLWVLRRIFNGESRIIIDPGHEDMPKDAAEVKKWRADLALFLRKNRAPYSVRYDDVSEKIVVVPSDKIDIFCWGRRGRRAKAPV